MGEPPLLNPDKYSKSQPPRKTYGLWPLFVTLGVIILFLFTPLFSYVIGLVPEAVIRHALSGVYQDTILDDTPGRLDQPRRLTAPVSEGAPTQLKVLSHYSGVCFLFEATMNNPNQAVIETSLLDGAKRGTPIAEIIAISAENREYPLEDVSFSEEDAGTLSDSENKRAKSVICQKFGRQSSIVPDVVTAIYVRPLQPFTPSKIVWTSVLEPDSGFLQ